MSGSSNSRSPALILGQNRFLQLKMITTELTENRRGKSEKDKWYGWFETVKIILQEYLVKQIRINEMN